MEGICRLCCSTKFVNNDIFDEENALYLKLSLYLPIKVLFFDVSLSFPCDILLNGINGVY